MPRQGGGGGGQWTLKELIQEWKKVNRQIDTAEQRAEEIGPGSVVTGTGLTIRQLKERRRNFAERIVGRVGNDPDKYERAVELGFNENLLRPPGGQDTGDITEGATTPGAGGGGGGQVGPPRGDEDRDRDRDRDKAPGRDKDKDLDPSATTAANRGQRADNRLLGDKGKHYDLVRGPKGSYAVRYKFKIKGEAVTIGLRIRENELRKYGFQPRDAKSLTRAQMGRIKNIGRVDWLAPHMRRGDGNILKSLTRSLEFQYGGQPILRNDEVMATIIANSMFGWNAGEFDNQLRQTKWFKNTNAYQRDWATRVAAKEKKDIIRSTMEKVVNHLEDVYGFGWTRHVDGGMRKAREWAENIASGKLGEPSMGFDTWSERTFDRAAEIEGTNAWISNEQEREEKRKWMNRPEEMFERVRGDALSWLGYDKRDTPRLDRDSLQAWANDLVSGTKSEGDWQNFLRGQMKRLYPYFDANLSFQEQASPYKSIAERLLGDVLDWGDPLLRDFAKLDDNRKATGDAMSLHDFERRIRGDEKYWKEGTAMWDEGMNIVRALEQTMLGVG